MQQCSGRVVASTRSFIGTGSRVEQNYMCTPYAAICIGLAKTLNVRCIYGIFGREITECTAKYGAYIRFWPTLHVYGDLLNKITV